MSVCILLAVFVFCNCGTKLHISESSMGWGGLPTSDCVQELNRCLKRSRLKSAQYPEVCYCYLSLIKITQKPHNI